MRRWLLLAAVLLGTAAPAQIIVTPTLVSAQSGTDLYCAAKPLPGQVQVYCYITVTKTWDTLRFNSIFVVGDGQTAIVPDVVKLDAAGKITTSIGWFFTTAAGKTNWQVGINGQFQTGMF